MENFLSSVLMSSLLSLSAPQQTVEIHDLPAISGLWQIELSELHDPKKSYQSCQERYNFGANGKLTTTSGKERTEGEYIFRYIEESSLPALAMTTTFDNNEPDCSGNIINQSNDSFAFFVKLDNRHNPTKMQWCQDKDGNDCHARFWRILP